MFRNNCFVGIDATKNYKYSQKMSKKVYRKTIHQEVEFNAKPHEVYELLMDPKKHSGFTGSKCEVSRKVGGKINCYDGYIDGENIELIQDKKIVQKWRGKDFPDGHYSTVSFKLQEKDGKTVLKFIHENVPDGKQEHLNKGWKEQYWDKMKKYLS